jgi:hypothetical protein
MASSPTETALQHIVDCYGHALDAVGRGDLERVQHLLDETQRLLAGLHEPAQDSPAENTLRQSGAESHARLVAAMNESRRDVLHQLQKVRQGKKLLSTYGNRSEIVGTRLRWQV